MERMDRSICKKCLLADFAPEEYLENMRVYLKGLSDESKVEDREYQQRLRTCVSCVNLIEGICRKCGCFVEFRAAMKEKHCPDSLRRW